MSNILSYVISCNLYAAYFKGYTKELDYLLIHEPQHVSSVPCVMNNFLYTKFRLCDQITISNFVPVFIYILSVKVREKVTCTVINMKLLIRLAN